MSIPSRRSLWTIHSGQVHTGIDGTDPEFTTTVRKRGGRRPKASKDPADRGKRLLWGSVLLLAALAGVAFYVSYAAQFGFVYAIKRLITVAAAEAVIPDAGMLICALLALAMAVQGARASRLLAARLLVIAFAGLSAVMNYEAANSYSVHAITVYVMPPAAFAVCTDLAISVVRGFYYGLEDEKSPWLFLGHAVSRSVRTARLILLYSLRYVLDREGTWAGLKQKVFDAAPVPAPRPQPAANGEQPGTKKAALLALYRAHEGYGDKSQVYRIAAELAPQAGLESPGSARNYMYAELAAIGRS
jgi:hypothetical protein